jgi:hypothetical protein
MAHKVSARAYRLLALNVDLAWAQKRSREGDDVVSAALALAK